ncbi:hypothetical protein [uncultured Imperialibacter sp.]|uniref:hypothetical protein n=1 Tax=uncultured Imperialibacter sp. TaxID=1672639 RepID=UPI0030DBBF5E|tara:strand:- start:596 stop:1018 length:423 start_codon:yes stop_codon:yes gene_type:complete
MKKKWKIVGLTALAVLLSPILLLYLSVYNSRDCSQFVIDSYELHSGIDIPKVTFVNCYYDESTGTRISVYKLTSAINLQEFKQVTSRDNISRLLQGETLLPTYDKPPTASLYVASGEKWGAKWTYLVDAQSKKLWAELVY